MTQYQCMIMVLVFFLVIYVYFQNRRKRRKTIESIQNGKDVLVKWTYSPEEWAEYAGDESSGWIKNKDIPGDVFITTESIYVTNGSDEYFYEFGWKRVTQCSFFRSFLDLRIEWSDTSRSGVTEGMTQYHYEDFRLFVPAAKREEVLELVEEFKAMIEPNSPAQKTVKDSETTSPFGDDNS